MLHELQMSLSKAILMSIRLYSEVLSKYAFVARQNANSSEIKVSLNKELHQNYLQQVLFP